MALDLDFWHLRHDCVGPLARVSLPDVYTAISKESLCGPDAGM